MKFGQSKFLSQFIRLPAVVSFFAFMLSLRNVEHISRERVAQLK